MVELQKLTEARFCGVIAEANRLSLDFQPSNKSVTDNLICDIKLILSRLESTRTRKIKVPAQTTANYQQK